MRNDEHTELERSLAEGSAPDRRDLGARPWRPRRRGRALRADRRGLRAPRDAARHDHRRRDARGPRAHRAPSEDSDDVLQQLAERVSPRVLHASRDSLVQTRRQLDEYFGHERRLFDIPLDWRLTTRLPPRRPARDRADPLRPDGLVPRRRHPRGQPERRARGRLGARHQPPADRRAVPPRAAHRRRPRPVPRRPGGQGAAPHPGRRHCTRGQTPTCRAGLRTIGV